MYGTGLSYCRAVSTFWDFSHTTQHSLQTTVYCPQEQQPLKCILDLPGFCYVRIEEHAMSTAEPDSNLLNLTQTQEGEPYFSSQQDLPYSYTAMSKSKNCSDSLCQVADVNCCSSNHWLLKKNQYKKVSETQWKLRTLAESQLSQYKGPKLFNSILYNRRCCNRTIEN